MSEEQTFSPQTTGNKIIFSWEDINVSSVSSKSLWSRVPSRSKQLLHEVTGVACPGEILAVLGPSGSGKTTLLNALTFQSLPNIKVTGKVRCNGIPVSSISNWAAYVQQDDLYVETLTVWEHLRFYAMLRIGSQLPNDYKNYRISQVLEQLSLRKCESSQIRSISMGERRRLAFASEILTNPGLLICDEPTSGLDALLAVNVVEMLKKIADEGKTVICTIHQPSSGLFSQFDKVLVLTGGNTAFLGTPNEAVDFFNASQIKNYNPADYIIKLITVTPENSDEDRCRAKAICEKYEKSRQSKDIIPLFNNNIEFFSKSEKCLWWTQYWALMWRSWLGLANNRQLFSVHILEIPITGVIWGVLFFQQDLSQTGAMNINGALFSIISQVSFQTIGAVTPTICLEYPLFLREKQNGLYGTAAYYLSKFLCDIVRFSLSTIICMTICYFMIGLGTSVGEFLAFLGIVLCTMCASVSFAIFISCSSEDLALCVAYGSSILLPLQLLGGFFINLNSIPKMLWWLTYFSWFRFGQEAVMINQWSNVKDIECRPEDVICYKDGRAILEHYSYKEGNVPFDMFMLVTITAVFSIFSYFCMKIKTR